MVQAPPPFNTTDIARCERFKEGLERKGYDLQAVEYISESGMRSFNDNRDATESVFSGRRGERAATCRIHGNNSMVERALLHFGKSGGPWATAFEIELNKREVARTDIPVNLASCNLQADERISSVTLEDMPDTCKIESVHSHNVRDRNAAFHIHVKCKDSTDDAFNDTLSWLGRVVDRAALVSNEMCSGRKPEVRVRPMISANGKKRKQTRMVMF